MTARALTSRFRTAAIALTALVGAGLTLFAQTPAPQGAPPQPGAAPQGAATPTPSAPVPQGARGGGRNPNENADFSPKDSVPPRSPADQAKAFVLPPGYRMELVLAEPQIISPAVIEFDGNGRMYVVEFVSYMLDADGNGAHDPISRISRFESTKGDGVYDKHTVFADKLILPRMVLPLEDGVILTNETDSDDVVKLSDTNGDGVADKREVVYTGVGTGRDGNLEHEQNGFVWGLDNWIYSTYNAFRFRWAPKRFLREPTGPNGGQWGVAQDDDGKMWFICGGCEKGPTNFEVPVQYSSNPIFPDQFEPGFDTVWPIAGLSDTQGGMGRVRMPVGVLNHFTAGAGGDIVRSDRLPQDLRGDLLVGEPVGRLIRRAKIVKNEGITVLRNPYVSSEFILSSDPYFRPITIRNAPDGLMYVADMYHGIIQDSQWTLPGSYLRRKIEQYQLDKVVGHGRIWRVRYDGLPEVPPTPAQPNAGATPGSPAVPGLDPKFAPPRMYAETPAQIVAHLSDPNGWWRDTAQRLLILKQDKSIVPALQQIVRSSDSLVGRFHALWTLEGLGALDAALVREQMKDTSPRIRIQAIRASETLYKAGNKAFEADYRGLSKDVDPDVAIQALLTLKLFNVADLPAVVAAAQDTNKGRGVKEIGDWMVRPPANRGGGPGRGGPALTPEQEDMMQRGDGIFKEICFTCHGPDGLGQPLAGAEPGVLMAPPLAGSPRVQGHRDYVTKVLLHGLTGPVHGTTYTQVMVPMGATNKDEWISAIASYVRNSFGNAGAFVTPADVARVRTLTTSRKAMWTVEDLEASLPVLLPAQPAWKATASHNGAVASGALTLSGWTTAAPQQPGMWVQVEVPVAANLAEVTFESPAGTNGFGIGSLGGGTGTLGGGNSTVAQAGQGGGGRGAAAPGQPAALPGFYPRTYTVQTSMDGTRWSAPVAQGRGAPGTTVASFKPVQARFLRITTTAADAQAWSMKNLRLFVAGK
ncbi:MAG: c-type cytochrome [Vicinamibacterales bacterium]